MIQHEKRKDGVKQVINAQTVGSDDRIIATFTGKMRVTKNDFIVVTHPVEGFQKLRAKER